MKLLFSSPDLGELGHLVKRLVWASIPCAVCKDPVTSQLSVWVQQDIDLPLALRFVTHREARPRLPYWARALDSTPSATEGAALRAANGTAPLNKSTVRPIRMRMASATTLKSAARQTWPWHNASLVSRLGMCNVGLTCAGSA